MLHLDVTSEVSFIFLNQRSDDLFLFTLTPCVSARIYEEKTAFGNQMRLRLIFIPVVFIY